MSKSIRSSQNVLKNFKDINSLCYQAVVKTNTEKIFWVSGAWTFAQMPESHITASIQKSPKQNLFKGGVNVMLLFTCGIIEDEQD